MKLLIDGYNLLFKIFNKQPFSLLDEERDYLAELLYSYKKLKGHKIILVFDGNKLEKFAFKGITVIFTENGVSADQYIMNYVRKDRGVTVITSDNEIIRYVNSFNIDTVRSEEFAAKIEEAFYFNLKGDDDIEPFQYESTPGRKLKKKDRRKKRIMDKL